MPCFPSRHSMNMFPALTGTKDLLAQTANMHHPARRWPSAPLRPRSQVGQEQLAALEKLWIRSVAGRLSTPPSVSLVRGPWGTVLK